MVNKVVPVMDRIRAIRNSSFASSKEIGIETVVTMNLPIFRASAEQILTYLHHLNSLTTSTSVYNHTH